MGKFLFVAFQLIFLALFVNGVKAQSDGQKNNLYETFDNVVGKEVSGLYNGVQYNNEFIVLNDKHQFLEANYFLKGYVRYDNQDHYNVYMKYDLFYDELILRPQNSSSGLAFKLVKSLVDGFTINDKKFVNVTAFNEKTNKSFGYCELLSETKFFNVYKKTVKKSSKKFKEGKIFYEFDQISTYYLEYGNIFYPAKTRNELISIFPNYKTVIKDYYKGYKQLLKSDPDAFMKLLSARLTELEQSKTV